jgi:hypothetical protein
LTDYIQKIELAADLTCTGPGTLGLGDNKTGEIKADNTKNTPDEMRYAGDTATFDVSIFHDAAGIYDITVLWGAATNSHSITNAGLLMSEVNEFIIKADNPTADMGFTVTVIDPPAAPPVDSGYGTWLDTYPAMGSLTNHTDDAENGGVGDGMNNLLEYALGGDPTVDDAADYLPTSEEGGGWLYYIYNRQDPQDPALSYEVLAGTDLVNLPVTNATTDVGTSGAFEGFVSQTNGVQTTSEDNQFMKLNVTITE